MSDLISRDKIYDYIKAQINPYGKPFEGTAYEFGLKIMDFIKNMVPENQPTVEANPVVHGEWKQMQMSRVSLCSLCGYSIGFYEKHNFCPKCGADMRKKVK